MLTCGLIAAGIDVDCVNPMVSGVNDRLILINKDDIVSFTYAADKENITAITLATGKTGYAFQGKNDSVEPKTELLKSRFSTNQNHEVIFRAFDNSIAVKKTINQLMNGKYVAVVQNNHVNASGDSAFEIYGEIGGLEIAESNRMPADVESEASWYLALRTPERSKEPRVPASFWDTDFATTKTAVDNLL